MMSGSLVRADRPTNNLSAFSQATSVAELESTRVPAIVHEAANDAIKHLIEPIAKEHSSAPHMIYRHWADLCRSVVYGPGMTREIARSLDPDRYRQLVFVEAVTAANMARWTEEAMQIDPTDAHKIARKLARPLLETELAKFRIAPDPAPIAALING